MDKFFDKRVVIEADNVAICRDESLCQKCGKCKLVCNREMAVDGYYNDVVTNRAVCVNCGRCVANCPFGALKILPETSIVSRTLQNPNKKVVFFVSPAVRVSFGDAYGMRKGENSEKKIVAALKALGAAYVLDTAFGADLTTVEEAAEFLDRLKKRKLPHITSCCPSWVRYVETFIPERIKNLSSCLSPIGMQAGIIKTYFAKKHKIDPTEIFSVAITPCVAKKAEIRRSEMQKSAEQYGYVKMQDTDAVLTTKELVELLKQKGIDPNELEEKEFDSMSGSGAGVTYGKSGGVAKSVLSTAYFMLNGKNPPKSIFKQLKKENEITTGVVDLEKCKVSVAFICGTARAREFLSKNKKHLPNLIEVMACPGGCIGGVGQIQTAKDEESVGLDDAGKSHKKHYAHNNTEVKDVYRKFLGEPLKGKAHEMLHTTFEDRRADTGL